MKLDTTCPQKLEFNVEVEGAGVSDLKPRLLLKDSDLSFLVEGLAEGSKIVFETPILSKRSSAQTLQAKIEVVVKDRLLSVWDGQFEIDQTPVVKVTEAKVGGIVSSGATVVKVSPVEISTPKTVVKPVELKPVVEKKVQVQKPVEEKPKFTEINHQDPIEKLIDSVLK